MARNVRKKTTRGKSKSSNTATKNSPIKLALSQHAFHFSNSLKGLFKEPVSTLMTALVIAIALALPSCLYLMVSNAQAVTERWETTHDINVFVDGSLSVSNLQSLQNKISQREDVQLVRTISSQQALDELKQETQMQMISDAIGSNPLPHTLIVSPKNKVINDKTNASIDKLNQDLAALPSVNSVQLDAEWVMKFRSLVDLLKRSVYLLATLLALGVLLVVSNTIRLHVQQKQNEIEVKKLLGASDDFVRRPFLYLGFWYGFLGAIIAILLVNLLLLSLSGPAAKLSELYLSSFELRGLTLSDTLFIIIFASLLSLIGAWIAAQRALLKIDVS